jgi:hypothetical protein
MPIGALVPLPRLQIFGPDGHVLDGGLIYTYYAGTTTPVATYNDKDLLVANENPIVLSSSGVAPGIYIDPAVDYKFVVKTATGGEVWTQDHIYLNPAAALDRTATYGITIETCAGSEITPGIYGDLEIPCNSVITQWTVLADRDGSAVLDVWRSTYAAFPPTATETITGGSLPTLLSGVKAQDTVLAGWTTTLLAGDILRFNVNSASTVTRLQLQLTVRI